MPESIGENGYRYYGNKELEALQQILFYRELDFPLDKIKKAMQDEPSRLQCLHEQKSLLTLRQKRLHCILNTISEAIVYTEKGNKMKKEKMFTGLNKQEWEATLTKQNDYLKKEYDYDMFDDHEIQPEKLNDHAEQATKFMTFMAESLKNGVAPNDMKIKKALKEHIDYVNQAICPTDAASFLEEFEFFLTDDFHRQMYENIQIGLSYYIFTSAKMYAETH